MLLRAHARPNISKSRSNPKPRRHNSCRSRTFPRAARRPKRRAGYRETSEQKIRRLRQSHSYLSFADNRSRVGKRLRRATSAQGSIRAVRKKWALLADNFVVYKALRL